MNKSRYVHECFSLQILLDQFEGERSPAARKQRGRVVSVSNSQSRGLGFESRSDHYLDLIFGRPEFKSTVTLVNSQMVCLWPVGILNNVAQFELFLSVVCSALLALVL